MHAGDHLTHPTTVHDVAAAVEKVAPREHAEDWDNVGLLIGDSRGRVSRVMFTVDLTREVVAEACEAKCQMVVAYHPPIFDALKRVVAGTVVWETIAAGIAVYSPHTALDAAPGGTNDVLADAACMSRRGRRPLRPSGLSPRYGQGRVGTVAGRDRSEVIARLRKALGVTHLLVAGPHDGPAERVAVAAGAGGSLLGDALRAKSDVFVTGELRHHDALRAAAAGVTAIAALHTNTERTAVAALAKRLRIPGVRTVVSETDRDPFVIV